MNEIIEPAYDSQKYEDGIYKKWEENEVFKGKIDKNKEAFSIVLPPPNATGTLHLGHAVMVALEDIMIRFNKMKGKSTLWVPGTDHAAIATQSVVEAKLIKEGIKHPRKDLGREKLLNEIKKFAEESKSTIRSQIRKMGASCDWSRERYTLEEKLNEAVNRIFIEMFEDGLIYRGGRIVNWDPQFETTVSDDELEYKEEKTPFYYFQYGPVVIGTARPETKFEDKVIVVHPDDKRYKDLIGKEFEVEWIEGKIKAKVIADECIDMKLGTGAMTITPGHSFLDFELAQNHNLEIKQIIDFEGKIKKDVSKEFGGMDIKEARKKIVEKLDQKGLLVKIDEDYVHNIAVNYRGKGIIEPQVMKQWFIDVNKKVIDWKGEKSSIKEVLQDCVRSKMIKIVPDRFEKTYFNWIDNLQDWCISRQIWWGHQIPIWYKVDKETKAKFDKIPDSTSLHLNVLGIDGEVKASNQKPDNGTWLQDPDTLDTWFSSALWTFSSLGWPEKTEELEYFHPTSVLETGYDIIFFWVARMIIASTYALRKDGLPEEKCIPFKDVYLHGLIRDREGKKMSKSRPETAIDPLEMIKKYGADALRLSLVIGSTPGNDMRLYEEKIAGYRNFINKIWNASRFALMNVEEKDFEVEFEESMIKSYADKWILTELQKLIKTVDEKLEEYQFSEAGNKIYEFIWNQYCDWYLEISKGEHKNPAVLLFVLKNCLKLIHPFVPFVTEQLWSNLKTNTLLANENWPKYNKNLIFKEDSIAMEIVHEIITSIRKARAEMKVEAGKEIHAIIISKKYQDILEEKRESLMRLARLNKLEIREKKGEIAESKVIFIGNLEIHLPLSELIDPQKELERLNKEEEKLIDFSLKLEKKLNNKKFINNAPEEIVQKEKKRLNETKELIEKIKSQKENIKKLND